MYLQACDNVIDMKKYSSYVMYKTPTKKPYLAII